MRKKSDYLLPKVLCFYFFIVLFTLLIGKNVFAASTSLDSSIVTAQKGDTLTGNKLIITLRTAEIEILKDKITVTLDGASWNGYSDEGRLSENIAYKKVSDSEIEIHITPTDSMLEQDLTISVPLNCIVLADQAQITAITGYNTEGYTDGRNAFAKCSYSRAYLSGNVMQRKQGDEIYASTGSAYYNNLRINVIGNDVARTKNTITVTLEGMIWSRLNDSGSVKNNAGVSVLYKKTDKTTISLTLSNYNAHMTYSGYVITIPLTGTVTGTGELKAVVDFGVDGTTPSEVIFGYCSEGDISPEALSPDITVNNIGRVSDVIINDTTEQSFKKNTTFTLTLQQVYSFYQAPDIEGTGKYADKCSVAVSPDNQRQCVITLTDAVSNETGTIKISNIIIEKAASNTPRTENLTATFKGSGWDEYESDVVIGKYSTDAEYNPPLRITAENPYVSANMYIRTGIITFTDNGTDRNYSAGDRIVLTFDNDFYWFTEGAVPVLTTTGKFQDACEFEFNNENKKEAYIVFKKNISSQSEGTIVTRSLSAVRDSSGYFPVLNMTAYIDGEPTTSKTIQVGRYNAAQTGALEAAVTAEQSENSDNNSSTEGSGDSVESVSVEFIIGETSYYINGTELSLNSAPYIKNGYTMLPIRVLANLAGISDDGIDFADGTATFSINGEEIIVISAGEQKFYLKGEEKELSTSAEVTNGTMFLPMRDLINALGIPDENIAFDAETKTVTIVVDN